MKEFSALDNDLYKFTMQQAALHHYPDAMVKYKYKCRNPKELKNIDERMFFNNVLNNIDGFCRTRFNRAELEYLSNIPFMKPDYIAFLEDFTFKERYINLTKKDNGFDLEIEGPWVQTILFEVPLLAIIEEKYCNLRGDGFRSKMEGLKFLEKECENVNFHFAEFGTRRRSSKEYQYQAIETLLRKVPNYFVGTSNVEMAKIFNIKYIGTMAHEWLQAFQALVRVSDSQKIALETWAKEYRGDLGIALSDVVGFNAFLRDFDKYFAKLFDGCRHDSGCPQKWVDALINHYVKLGIDPKTKNAVFSDGLSFKEASDLESYVDGRVKSSYGIGTWLTNNCGFPPLQIVIKMIECNGKPVAKLSDDIGKTMCEDNSYMNYLSNTFGR